MAVKKLLSDYFEWWHQINKRVYAVLTDSFYAFSLHFDTPGQEIWSHGHTIVHNAVLCGLRTPWVVRMFPSQCLYTLTHTHAFIEGWRAAIRERGDVSTMVNGTCMYLIAENKSWFLNFCNEKVDRKCNKERRLVSIFNHFWSFIPTSHSCPS